MYPSPESRISLAAMQLLSISHLSKSIFRFNRKIVISLSLPFCKQECNLNGLDPVSNGEEIKWKSTLKVKPLEVPGDINMQVQRSIKINGSKTFSTPKRMPYLQNCNCSSMDHSPCNFWEQEIKISLITVTVCTFIIIYTAQPGSGRVANEIVHLNRLPWLWSCWSLRLSLSFSFLLVFSLSKNTTLACTQHQCDYSKKSAFSQHIASLPRFQEKKRFFQLVIFLLFYLADFSPPFSKLRYFCSM